jgi:polyisoprenoid-binding protein YceI
LEIITAEPMQNGTYHINGDLTIKDITHPIGFDAQINYADDSVTSSGKIVIDRTKYAMRFRSGNFFKDLGDTLIYNEFELDVKFTAKAVTETTLA